MLRNSCVGTKSLRAAFKRKPVLARHKSKVPATGRRPGHFGLALCFVARSQIANFDSGSPWQVALILKQNSRQSAVSAYEDNPTHLRNETRMQLTPRRNQVEPSHDILILLAWNTLPACHSKSPEHVQTGSDRVAIPDQG